MRSRLDLYGGRVEGVRNRIKWSMPGGKVSGCFLDIGCGTGNGVVAASSLGAALSIGVDIDFGVFAHDFDFAEFRQVCAHFGGNPDSCVLIEGDILTMKTAPTQFDCVLMFDSIEHVPDPNRFIRRAFDLLAPGGIFICETSPLYYSPIGHHLFKYFPIDEAPWVHLWKDFESVLAAAPVDPWSMGHFVTLNKVTHDEIMSSFRDAGFEVEHEHRGVRNEIHSARFEKFKDRIKPEYLERPNLLFEDWIVVVGKRPT